MPFGAERRTDGAVAFRLWAPAADTVDVELSRRTDLIISPLERRGDGWFEVAVPGVESGTRYRYRIDRGDWVPDPAARYQPEGVHCRSEIVDPVEFEWPDGAWHGRPWHEAVIYELHVGTFSPEGTFAGAERRLDSLVDLGVTAIQLMPVAEAPGRWNWGYDGVLPFAPEARYGRPEDLKRLVAGAHARGLMALLDVVYNHFGPEGNYLHRYAPQFFTDRHKTPWGAAINFDGDASRTVRDFFVHNALYWVEEFGFDGLRFDAVHAIVDDSEPDILAEIALRLRDWEAAHGRAIHLVVENDDNIARHLRRDRRGRPVYYTAQWNDDIHHVLHVLITGEREGYYGDYIGRPVERLGRALTEGFIYQGEPSRHRHDAPRGEGSAHLPPTAFVGFLQNHDQIGNRALGERIVALAPEEAVRFAITVLLLAPSPPLLFMGEEWGSAQPFLFFCDFGADLATSVRDGRRREFKKFAAFADPSARQLIPDPLAEATFAAARLDWTHRDTADGQRWLELYRSLLAVRRREITPRLADVSGRGASLEMPNEKLLIVRWPLGDGATLTLTAAPAATPVRALGNQPPGRRLAATAEARWIAGEPLPAWYAAWFLDAPEPPP